MNSRTDSTVIIECLILIRENTKIKTVVSINEKTDVIEMIQSDEDYEELKQWLEGLNLVQYFDSFKNKRCSVEVFRRSDREWNINDLYFLGSFIPYHHKLKLLKQIKILQNDRYFNPHYGNVIDNSVG
eukprot:916712_1